MAEIIAGTQTGRGKSPQYLHSQAIYAFATAHAHRADLCEFEVSRVYKGIQRQTGLLRR